MMKGHPPISGVYDEIDTRSLQETYSRRLQRLHLRTPRRQAQPLLTEAGLGLRGQLTWLGHPVSDMAHRTIVCPSPLPRGKKTDAKQFPRQYHEAARGERREGFKEEARYRELPTGLRLTKPEVNIAEVRPRPKTASTQTVRGNKTR